MAHVAFLGAGLLGAGFVEAACRRGWDVVVWNRSRAKAEALTRFGARVADSPAEAAAGAERIHLVLSEDDAVDAVIAAMGDITAPIVDHSTNHPARVAERVARLDAAGVSYLHAPVFMAPANAAAATGLMVVSGAAAKIDAAREVLTSMIVYTLVYAVLAVIEVKLFLTYVKRGADPFEEPKAPSDQDEDAPLQFAY